MKYRMKVIGSYEFVFQIRKVSSFIALCFQLEESNYCGKNPDISTDRFTILFLRPINIVRADRNEFSLIVRRIVLIVLLHWL